MCCAAALGKPLGAWYAPDEIRRSIGLDDLRSCLRDGCSGNRRHPVRNEADRQSEARTSGGRSGDDDVSHGTHKSGRCTARRRRKPPFRAARALISSDMQPQIGPHWGHLARNCFSSRREDGDQLLWRCYQREVTL